MLKEERQRKIMNELYSSGNVIVDALAEQFHTSRDTIRRDLNELEEQGILKRVYGGAIPWKMETPAVDQRMYVGRDEKYVIAQKAIGMLKPHSLIAIDGGSTNAIFASLIPLSCALQVVTNSFPVAEELKKRPQIEVIFLGGRYNKTSDSSVGEAALQQLSNYYFDQCFLGLYGIDPKVGVSVPAPYEDEVPLKQAIVASSKEVNFMCVSSKLGLSTNYVVCGCDQVSQVICGRTLTAHEKRNYPVRFI
ncbi:MAG: DeoR/GlpR family DNA-binding transcription regulator [Solobacterium sp.]|jgi:DeoR/GlpR family transcriptional regulator of sugar metabolism|nr:DeoR/GlpR family DNA-binding transcription regulator [Solobacterium sp.]MCH4222322.1 DeoR/GlpR family DNA-binding transcription regulator [Solobacterium sp.]MCH4265539.1 DeoR/GlpR family DNA-binding transcription regulator [Solobacterium sp.]